VWWWFQNGRETNIDLPRPPVGTRVFVESERVTEPSPP